jgi:hypothetical protein
VAKEAIDPVLARALDTVGNAGARAVRRVLGRASDETGLDADELMDRIERTPSGLLLAGEVVEAAARTSVPEKLTAFARLLANAATDGSTVDTDRVLVGILAPLEEPHIRLLNLLDTTPPPTRMQGHETIPGGWDAAAIMDRDVGLRPALEMLVAALQSTGLVEDNVGPVIPIEGAPPKHHLWATTSLGRTVLIRLRELSQDSG